MFSYYIKKAIFTGAVTASLIAIGGAATAMAAIEKYSNIEKELFSQAISNTVQTEESYVVKDVDGLIGVFDSDGRLLYTLDVYTKTLPAADRALLKKGISASNRKELYEILGDYDG